jgi:hypothetical protein
MPPKAPCEAGGAQTLTLRNLTDLNTALNVAEAEVHMQPQAVIKPKSVICTAVVAVDRNRNIIRRTGDMFNCGGFKDGFGCMTKT